MKMGWRRIVRAVRPGRVVGMAMAILCFSFAMMIGGDREPMEMQMPEILPTPGSASSAAETGLTVLPDCDVIQIMGFTRCGHSVTRRIKAPDAVIGCNFSEVQLYYDLWTLESFYPSDIEMRREIELYCPMHVVLSSNGVGEIVLSQNVYGDGMAVIETYDQHISEFDEGVRDDLLLGIGFDSREDALDWLHLH